MHIPDGFLSAPVAAACAALSVAAVGAAGSRARALLGSRAAALMGVTSAFVFAAQMLTFPVAGGTSGHLIGGVLAAVLLGPSASVMVMTAVIALQCLVFGDGGLVPLGANVLNMAVLQPLVGFAVYRAVAWRAGGLSPARRLTAVAFGAWVGTVVAAATCAGELALSNVVPASVGLAAMVGVHLAIGLGEALISALVVATVLRLRPGLLEPVRPGASAGGAGAVALLGLAVALGLAFFVSPFACTWPDGLEHAIEHLGIAPSQARVSLPAPLRDYAMPGVSGPLATSLAAGAGTLLAFAVCAAIGLALAPRRSARVASPANAAPTEP